ncbi:hypothetical protein PMIN01_06474 [Paraphaeosphaeria minitans]|uniref:RING-type domain-containing protein n=1 Tax=Paraphaeosphaeria minitans TaxID=565426 RepID=A0A9P6KQZ6_9PLEO|nr:hypothetical protein PMIN01_06474 [Paraphaeosphaeria minitans]
MSDQSTTLEDFISSNIKTVQSTRSYLLDKPCTRCHQSTNVRVHLPACSHRICSACLADFAGTHRPLGSVICPACSTYWFTLPSEREMEKRSKKTEVQSSGSTKAERIMPTWSISTLWRPETSISSQQISDIPRSFAHNHLDGSDSCSTATVSDGSSEDLDLQVLRVQGQWKFFCEGQDLAKTEAKMQAAVDGEYQPGPVQKSQATFCQNKEMDEERLFELEATESRTQRASTTQTGSQNQGQPPIVDQEVVADASQVEEAFSKTVFPAGKEVMKPSRCLSILVVIVCLVLELISGLILAVLTADS